MIDKKKAEFANSISHGIAFVIFAIASVFLLQKGTTQNSPVFMFGLIIFIVSILLLYGFSTAYHVAQKEKLKHTLRHFDHAAIYILIAGSYTPILLGVIQGTLGWIVFGIIWFLAISGILYEMFFLGKHPKVSLVLYLSMGWIVVLIAKPFWDAASAQVLICMLLEALFYTTGTYFYWKDKKHTYFHAIWHVFVWLGTLSHFVAVWLI